MGSLPANFDDYYNFDPGFFETDDDVEYDEDGNPLSPICESCGYTNCQCDASHDDR